MSKAQQVRCLYGISKEGLTGLALRLVILIITLRWILRRSSYFPIGEKLDI
ncbi:hypothetical protein [Chamaesiphon sp.]|uniref:hypothetical protein n=1 Tax=Chamaesiphon sp. TaxID=2814140 RepID=UPI00359485CE